MSKKLDYFHFFRERFSQDGTNNLSILNGRCGDDKSVGALTFRNCSTIDYSVVSHGFLQFVDNFSVTELRMVTLLLRHLFALQLGNFLSEK